MRPKEHSNTSRTARSAASRSPYRSQRKAANSNTLAWTAAASALLFLLAATARADILLTEGTNISVDVAADGRIVTDLLGRLWIVPAVGGEAVALTDGLRAASRPRWSPSGDRIVFEVTDAAGTSLWLYRIESGVEQRLGDAQHASRQPAWHPDGTRVAFSSERHGTDLDIWEIDIATGVSWRLTQTPGAESEPAWSANGRDLVWIHHHDDLWSLMLRRRGAPEEVLAVSETPLASPSWRPDGSLITYLRLDEDGWEARMSILSEPRLDRQLLEEEDLFLSPIAWRGRQQMVYTANGHIRLRGFDEWTSDSLRFTARVDETNGFTRARVDQRALPEIERPPGRIVLRPARLFDGLSDSYVPAPDIVIEKGRIAAVEERRERTGEVVIDVTDLTALPGMLDAWAALPEDTDPSIGPLLLAFGVTTMVVDGATEELGALWSGKEVPGPRLLQAAAATESSGADVHPWLVHVSAELGSADELSAAVAAWQQHGVAVLAEGWQIGTSTGASLVLGWDSRPPSPGGLRYDDQLVAAGRGAVTYVSGLADGGTTGVRAIWSARPAEYLSAQPRLNNRFATTRDLSAVAADVVLGSRSNGMPPGIATQAELLALVDSGLSAPQALRAAGVNPASALGLGLGVGRVATGAEADLVLVDGDPLTDVSDSLNVVAIVRNGRFYSVSGLLDRHVQAESVE